jgi:hypothetical protein
MQDLAQHITQLVEAEVAAHLGHPSTLVHFQKMRVKQPRPVSVQFSGGIMQTCWTVTRSDGDYQVIYLPTADYFSLCVGSDFGPLDIGVHGGAIQCFSAVV